MAQASRLCGPVTLTLSATADGKPQSWSVEFHPAGAPSGDLLATLAARTAVRDLKTGRGGRGSG